MSLFLLLTRLLAPSTPSPFPITTLQASSSRASEEVAALSHEVSARVKIAGAADLSLRAAEAACVDQALRQLAALSRAIADFDSGVVLGRSFAEAAPSHPRGKFLTLDNFAVIVLRRTHCGGRVLDALWS